MKPEGAKQFEAGPEVDADGIPVRYQKDAYGVRETSGRLCRQYGWYRRSGNLAFVPYKGAEAFFIAETDILNKR